LPVETPRFGRDRCHFVGRDATIWKYHVNSRRKLSKWKLINFIHSNEEISTNNRKYTYTISEPNELKSLSRTKRNFIDPRLQHAVFLLL
jgi:hypothetical protein